MLIALATLACTPGPALGEGLSEQGTWWVQSDEARLELGDGRLALCVEDVARGAPAEGLTVLTRPSMVEMAHSLPVTRLAEEGGGTGCYVGTFDLAMPGVWELTGYLSDLSQVESYTLWIEVMS